MTYKILVKKSEILVRRQQVWSFFTQGYDQIQIAEKLGVSYKTISRDLQELKKDAKDWLENLPMGEIQLQQKKNFDSINRVGNELWQIYENTKDENKKVKILNLINTTSKSSSDLMSERHLLKTRRLVRLAQGYKTMSQDLCK